MGPALSKKKEAKVIIIGYHGAGKSSFFNHLSRQNQKPPNISSYFQVDFLKYKKISLEVWDLDGKDEVRPLWRHYLANTKYVIFVVDSTDRDHIAKAKELLHSTCGFDHLENARLVIAANKQDLPDAMNEAEIERSLELYKLPSTTKRCVQLCSATTGEGVKECLDWIADQQRMEHIG